MIPNIDYIFFPRLSGHLRSFEKYTVCSSFHFFFFLTISLSIVTLVLLFVENLTIIFKRKLNIYISAYALLFAVV